MCTKKNIGFFLHSCETLFAYNIYYKIYCCTFVCNLPMYGCCGLKNKMLIDVYKNVKDSLGKL